MAAGVDSRGLPHQAPPDAPPVYEAGCESNYPSKINQPILRENPSFLRRAFAFWSYDVYKNESLEPLLKAAEAAEALRCSRYTVYRLARDGKLAYTLVGSDMRFPASALRRYVERHLVEASA